MSAAAKRTRDEFRACGRPVYNETTGKKFLAIFCDNSPARVLPEAAIRPGDIICDSIADHRYIVDAVRPVEEEQQVNLYRFRLTATVTRQPDAKKDAFGRSDEGSEAIATNVPIIFAGAIVFVSCQGVQQGDILWVDQTEEKYLVRGLLMQNNHLIRLNCQKQGG